MSGVIDLRQIVKEEVGLAVREAEERMMAQLSTKKGAKKARKEAAKKRHRACWRVSDEKALAIEIALKKGVPSRALEVMTGLSSATITRIGRGEHTSQQSPGGLLQ